MQPEGNGAAASRGGGRGGPDPAVVERLRRRAEAVDRQYQGAFAGQPRLTRAVPLLDAMIEEVDDALRAASALPASSEGLSDVGRELRRQRDLYRSEREAILQAQAEGPAAFRAHSLRTWAALVGARYRRHFAGRRRLTRDLALLQEMGADGAFALSEIDRAVVVGRVDGAALADARRGLAADLELFAAEREAIRRARQEAATGEGEGAARLAAALASCANAQFALYGAHFAGRPRLSRRAALLERILGALIDLRAGMAGLRDGGLRSAENDANIGVIDGRVAAWRVELEAVVQARRAASIDAAVAGLGDAARALSARYGDEYAGQLRQTRDLGPLTVICDGLHDLAREMDAIDRIVAHQANAANLAAALENLTMYEAEWEAIRRARRQ